MRRTIPVALSFVIVTTPSWGGDVELDEPDARVPDARLHLPEAEISIGLWAPRLGGDIRLDAFGVELPTYDLGSVLGLDQVEPVVGVDARIKFVPEWSFEFNHVHYESSYTGESVEGVAFGTVALQPGSFFTASLEMASNGFEIGRDLFVPVKGTRDAGGTYLVVRGLLAARHLDLDMGLVRHDTPSQQDGFHGEWLAIMPGLEVDTSYALHSPGKVTAFGLRAGFTAGPAIGDDGGTMLHVKTAVTLALGSHASLRLGYQHLVVDVAERGSHFDGDLEGLFLMYRYSF